MKERQGAREVIHRVPKDEEAGEEAPKDEEAGEEARKPADNEQTNTP